MTDGVAAGEGSQDMDGGRETGGRQVETEEGSTGRTKVENVWIHERKDLVRRR